MQFPKSLAQRSFSIVKHTRMTSLWRIFAPIKLTDYCCTFRNNGIHAVKKWGCHSTNRRGPTFFCWRRDPGIDSDLPAMSYAYQSSNTLDEHRDTLPNAYAHGTQGITTAAALQLIHCRRHQARTTHPERMAERNRAAVRIDARVVVGHAELPQYRQTLGSESFVEFDDIHLFDTQTALQQQLPGGGRRADTHDARRYAGCRHADDARARRQAISVDRSGVGQQQGTGAVIDAGGITRGH